MSDVMKAIRDVERHGEFDPDVIDEDLAVEAYEPMRDHIGELHSAIARLQGELAKDPDFVCSMFTSVAFTDLFALLPTDWAGDEG